MPKEIHTGKISEPHIWVKAKTDNNTLQSTKQADKECIRHLLAWITESMEDKNSTEGGLDS